MLSIIIPTLNEEKILEKTLKALAPLAIEHEIIVSDGGSTDKTVAIAEKYSRQVIKNIPGQKQNIAIGRNLGAKAASGEFLVFLDADVQIPDINNFFQKALYLFNKEKKLTGLTVFLKVFPEHATLADKFFFQLVNFIHYIANNWLKWGSASGEFQLIRASAFKMVNGYDENLVVGEDNKIFSKLAKIGITRVETGLHVLHTCRRAHKTGWAKLLYLWLINNLWNQLFKHSFSKEWEVIR
jgi:glycosyltransferase involved in cell wall biosynthesis